MFKEKTKTRNKLKYHCQADFEYWSIRNKTYKPTPKLCIAKRPVYVNNYVQRHLPWIWNIDRRETTVDISHWEINTVPIQYSGASMKKKITGHHALDYCSSMGLSSWYLGFGHDKVTTIEPQTEIRTLVKHNINALGTSFYENDFIDIDCDKYNVIETVKKIDWTLYDTIRLGSSSYSVIYDAIKHQLDNSKIVIYKPTHDFITKLSKDGFNFYQPERSVDYFAKG